MKGFNNKLVCVTFLCAVFCFAWSTQDQKNVKIPAPLVLMFRKHAETCGQENGVPPSHLLKIVDNTLPNDEPNLKFFHCVAFKPGYIEQNGHFVVDKMTTFEVVDGTVEDYTNTIKECNKIVKENDIQTLAATSKCLHKAYHFNVVKPQ